MRNKVVGILAAAMNNDSLCREKSRRVDAIAINDLHIPGIVLMENAGRGCVESLLQLECTGPVVVLAGTGNNGGDGLVIARHLELNNIAVKVVVVGEASRICGDAATNLEIARSCRFEIVEDKGLTTDGDIHSHLESVDGVATAWMIDAMLGTGASGNPRSKIARVIRVANQFECKKVAVDLPTGLDCDTGIPGTPCFRADFTMTFVAKKEGFSDPRAQSVLGEVRVVSIGFDSKELIRRVRQN